MFPAEALEVSDVLGHISGQGRVYKGNVPADPMTGKSQKADVLCVLRPPLR
jgi:hypothetical protein